MSSFKDINRALITTENHTDNLVIRLSNSYEIIYINQAALNVFELNEQDVLNKNFFEVFTFRGLETPISEKNVEKLELNFYSEAKTRVKNKSLTLSWKIVKIIDGVNKTNGYLLVTIADSVENGADEEVKVMKARVLEICKDITGLEFYSNESIVENVRRVCEYLGNIIGKIPESIYWMNVDGVYLGCNEKFAKIFDLKSRHEIVGKSYADLYDKKTGEYYRNTDREVINTGQPITREEPRFNDDGSVTIYLSSKTPLFDKDKKVIGLLGISVDITEHKKIEEELKNAKETAEAANHVKTEFLQNMRHDFRTPFAALEGLSGLMSEQETDPTKKEYLGYIQTSAHLLLEQLNEIMEFINSEEGRVPVLHKPFVLKEAVSEAMFLLKLSAEQKKIKLCDCIDPFIGEVIGDRFRTQQIVSNLLSNAIKFTPQGGQVNVSVSVAGADTKMTIVKIEVSDTGIGIPEEKQDVIFEKFNRLKPSYKESVYTGKGLGLNLVKRYLEELEGEIRVSSELGKGSTFTVIIPYRTSLLQAIKQ